MSNKNINVEMQFIETKLIKLNFDYNDSQTEAAEIIRENNIKDYAYDKENELLFIEIEDKISGPFNLNIVVKGVYNVSFDSDDEELQERSIAKLFESTKELAKLCYPLLAETTLLTGQISGKSIGMPIIIRPKLQEDDDKE
ncbi:hypothetical protein [Bacillus sp. FSL W8-0629]|uniref:hypothetical protein n=1 Tax=Bacillus sp. FSL W8-0629 TaxID=2954626 RepID=UPI00315810AD